jgi:hypothetical protein
VKNLLISLFVALVVLVSFVRPALAEVTSETADNVLAVTIQVTKKSKFSTRTTHKDYRISFGDKAVSTLLKPCVTDNGSSRICLYQVKGSKEIYVFDYEYSDSDDSIVNYETKKTALKR